MRSEPGSFRRQVYAFSGVVDNRLEAGQRVARRSPRRRVPSATDDIELA